MRGVLLDTNVLSELRKAGRAKLSVIDWRATFEDEDLFLSVLILGEIRHGIELIRTRDRAQADAIERWLERTIQAFHGRIIPVGAAIAETWGRCIPPEPVPDVDGLIAATALEYDMTVATRNTRHFVNCGVPVVNPFEDEESHA